MAEPSSEVSRALDAWQDALARARDDFARWKQHTESSLAGFASGADPAGAGYDDALIQAESALTSLRGQLQAAYRSLATAYTAALSAAPPETAQRLAWQQSEQSRTLRTMDAQLNDDGQATLTAAQAAVSRALFEAASHEWNQPRPCPSCGEPVVVGAVWQATTFTCASCGTQATHGPAPLTDRFYGGDALEAICAEQALDAWRALQVARRRYDALLHPLPADHEPVATAATTWASELCSLWGELHPAWDPASVEQHTAARTRAALADTDDEAARARRQRFQAGVDVAATGDLGRIMQWAQDEVGPDEMPALVAELTECVHEHGDRTAAWQVIALQHHVQQVAQDRDTWMRDRLAELDAAARQR